VKTICAEPDSLVQFMPGRSVEALRLYRRHFEQS